MTYWRLHYHLIWAPLNASQPFVVSIPPKLAVADCVRHLKGASAHAINHMPGSDGEFKWQEGYGALSIGERSLETTMAYAAKQKERHQEQPINPVYERIDEE
jgi:REP element-mobilizing transposase RayT